MQISGAEIAYHYDRVAFSTEPDRAFIAASPKNPMFAVDPNVSGVAHAIQLALTPRISAHRHCRHPECHDRPSCTRDRSRSLPHGKHPFTEQPSARRLCSRTVQPGTPPTHCQHRHHDVHLVRIARVHRGGDPVSRRTAAATPEMARWSPVYRLDARARGRSRLLPGRSAPGGKLCTEPPRGVDIVSRTMT